MTLAEHDEEGQFSPADYAPGRLFSLAGKRAVVTGGTGVLGGAMARGLAAAGAKVAILGRRAERAAYVADAIRDAGGDAIPLPADVLNRNQLETAATTLVEQWGGVDILINAAGGNVADATIVGDVTFFNMSQEAFRRVMDLNLVGTVLPSQAFGRLMVEHNATPGGVMVNVSSMAAERPLTRVMGYAAAKAAIDNYTRWLAVEFATQHGEGLRVNAIAPGFFLGEQNRDFLLNRDGSLTARGQQIVDHTPMRRFGLPQELIGTVIWLCSDAARFVTGVVVPVDGGFSAFGGV
jgi:NAD(P)-dependent dehydrogenase (short-subunit alcohol dehydrogenase family)